MANSCLVEKLGHYLRLSPDDAERLARLEHESEELPAQSLLRAAGAPVRRLYVVKRGWMYAYSHLPNGSRQVAHIHYPGDLVGLTDVAFERATLSLAAVSDATVCPFPKSALDQIFIHSPALSALLFSLGMVEHAVLSDRLRIMARSGAVERVTHFLLEVVSRLRITHPDIGEGFSLPMTQELLGDAIGLSNVYVSRALSELQQRGWIERRARRIRLLNEDAMRAAVDFNDRHFRIDTSWFPGALSVSEGAPSLSLRA
jgi:CRP-like cAMP-binding protein